MKRARTASTEDELLIARFKQGEAKAFDRLMAMRLDRVFALAWGVLRNREEAKDAAQEVFIKLHRALPSFPESGNLDAWLYRVCLNHCIDRKRRMKRAAYELTEDDWERLQGSRHNEPEFRAYQSETGRIVRQAVDRLPERQRLVFTLRHYNLLSINEIAEAIGCTSGAVKAHLSRATAHLRDWLRDQLFVSAEEVD